MERDLYKRRISLSSAVLCIWLILITGGLGWLGVDNMVLCWALLALITTLALTRPFRFAEWVATGIGALLYTGNQVVLLGPTQGVLIESGVVALALLGAAVTSSTTARQIWAGALQLEHAQILVDELTPRDTSTGLIRWQYARDILESEVLRSRRYDTDLSMLLIRVVNWDGLIEEHGHGGVDTLMEAVAAIMMDTLRNVDIPTRFDEMTFAAILPQTPAQGAQMIAQRLVDTVAREVRVALCVGLVHFPDDAGSDEELIRAAEAALQFGLTSDQPIIRYAQLRSTIEEETPTSRMSTSPGNGPADSRP